MLGLLVDEYEQKNDKIDTSDSIQAIKIRMEERQLKQKDLINIIGGKSRVSEVLRKKRKLTLEMIRNLSKNLDLSTDILVRDYQLNT